MTRDASTPQRVVVVTGGAMGIGAAVVKRLAVLGHRVFIADRDVEAARLTADHLCSQGYEVKTVAMDVSDSSSITHAFTDIERLAGRCDILVNSAGVATVSSFLEFPLDEFTRTMNINVTGTLLCSQAAARLMVKHNWGRIINIASVAGMRAVGKGRTAYGTSKGAVIALTRQMAVELAEHGITANAVCPGPVDTPRYRDIARQRGTDMPKLLAGMPFRRIASAEELGGVIAMAASDRLGYMSGAIITVDAGLSVGTRQ